MRKFASITANLLARKGDAQPSTMPDGEPMNRSFVWSGATPSAQRTHEPLSRVPPTGERAAERSAFVRFRPEQLEPSRDLRLDQVMEPVRTEMPVVLEAPVTPPAEARPAETLVAVPAEAAVAPALAIVADAQPKVAARPVRESVREPAHTDKPRRLFVNLTPDEYERLGIVAVKRDATRHQLLRDAFDAFLRQASEELKACACVSGESCKGSCQ